jgi:hypothetical protein
MTPFSRLFRLLDPGQMEEALRRVGAAVTQRGFFALNRHWETLAAKPDGAEPADPWDSVLGLGPQDRLPDALRI